MILSLTYHEPPGVFVLEVAHAGQILSALETVDLTVIEKELHTQALRMRHLARGKTFEIKQPRHNA